MSLTVLAEELHRSTDTPSTATTELRTLCLFRGQSWWRQHILLLVRRRPQHLAIALCARFVSGLDGEHTYHLPTRRRPQHLAFAFQACLAGDPGGGTTPKKGQCTFCALSLFRVVPSFKLHRSRWLRGQIIEHPIHVIHLIYYSIHHLLQH